MKKILLITRGIPTKGNPMWGNFELDQAKALRDYGHKVVCLSIDRNIRLNGLKFGFTRTTVEGIKMYSFMLPLPERLLPREAVNAIIDVAFKYCVKRIHAEEGVFDVVHGHYLKNIRLATKYTAPVKVGTEHWSELKRSRIKKSVKLDAREAYPALDRLITVSYPMQEIIRKEFEIDSEFVGCVIDSVFEYAPRIDDTNFRFIAVGSLFKIKGFDIAIKAFARAGFSKDIHFHIIGDGSERAALQRLIEDLNLVEQVTLEGRKTREEIMKLMRNSSAYVLSSRSENFATACMEALCAGIPALMTECGGPEDFVDDKSAFLVPVEDIDAMSEGMKYMVNNINNYDGKKISESIKAKYAPSAIAQQLTSIYDKITNK